MTPETFAPAAAGVRERSGPKPRMAFFRINDLGLPEFVNDHVRCLEQFFDLVVVKRTRHSRRARHRSPAALVRSGASPGRASTRARTSGPPATRERS